MDTYINKVELVPGIMCYKNVFPESYKIIEAISEQDWEDGYVAASRFQDTNDSYGVLNKDLRDVGEVFINHPSSNEDLSIYSYYEKTKDFGQELHNNFSVCEDDYIKHYNVKTVSRKYKTYQILKYEVGQHFGNHVDSVPGFERTISQTYYFNDSYEGGELYFDRFNLRYKPEARDLLIFPSMWVYSHSAEPVTSGIRYALVNFIQ